MNGRQRPRPDTKPIESIDATNQIKIDNITFASSDARFLQTDKNSYTQTMYGDLKGVENSHAKLMYNLYGSQRAALLKMGKAFMQKKAGDQEDDTNLKVSEAAQKKDVENLTYSDRMELYELNKQDLFLQLQEGEITMEEFKDQLEKIQKELDEALAPILREAGLIQ